jgi:LuxR family quorum-sensing system transcriptional regulator CciR
MYRDVVLPVARCLDPTNQVVDAIRRSETTADLARLMDAVTREMGFRHYALVHHLDFQQPGQGLVEALSDQMHRSLGAYG